MTPGTILSFIPLAFGLFAAQPVAMQTVTRLVVQDEVILRVPVEPRPMGPPIEWVEKRAPKCIPLSGMRAALLSGPDQVDFIYDNHARMRARLESGCTALDYYDSFYLQPQDDRLCARRDAIYSRAGGNCTIERFGRLVPELAR